MGKLVGFVYIKGNEVLSIFVRGIVIFGVWVVSLFYFFFFENIILKVIE